MARALRAEKTLHKVMPQTVGLAQARQEYLDQLRVRPSTKRYYTLRLAYLTGSKLTDITPRDINRILDPLPIPSRAQTVRTFSAFFNWCVRRYYLDTSPCSRIQAPREQSRSRVLSDTELKAIWDAAAECGTMGCILRVLICTGLRKGECEKMQWSWLNEKERTVTIPASNAKNKREHIIPISAHCVELLIRQKANCGRADGYIFSTRATPNRPYTCSTLAKRDFHRRLGGNVEHWTPLIGMIRAVQRS